MSTKTSLKNLAKHSTDMVLYILFSRTLPQQTNSTNNYLLFLVAPCTNYAVPDSSTLCAKTTAKHHERHRFPFGDVITKHFPQRFGIIVVIRTGSDCFPELLRERITTRTRAATSDLGTKARSTARASIGTSMAAA